MAITVMIGQTAGILEVSARIALGAYAVSHAKIMA